MKNIQLLLILILAILATSGCTSYRAIYDISLAHVERSPYANIHYGDSRLTNFKEDGLIKYRFEDDIIEIVWHPTASRLNFRLINKTRSAVKILWDEAVYIDEKQIQKGVLHPVGSYFQRHDLLYPGVIPPGAIIDDYVVPTDNRLNEPRTGAEWFEYELFPNLDTFEKLGTRSEIMEYIGKEVMFLLPLEVNDIENTYIFIFRVDCITVRKKTKFPFTIPNSSM